MAGLIQDTELFGTDIPRLEALREKGRTAFNLPTPKTEAWKYTRLHSLKADDFIVPPSKFVAELQGEYDECSCCCHDKNNSGCTGHCCDSAADEELKEEYHDGKCCDGTEQGTHCCCHSLDCRLDLPFDAWQLHFSNGQFVPIYPALPRGIEVMTLMEALVTDEDSRLLGKSIDLKDYPFAALNTAYLEEGLFIRVAEGVRPEKPLMLVNHTDCGNINQLSNLRNLIVVEAGASIELVEYYHYSGEPKSRYFNNIVNEIYLGVGAEMNHYKYQDEAFKAAHIALNTVQVKSGGIYSGFCLQQGADLGRNETRVRLLENEARAEVNSAYIMNGWATLDTTTNVEHLSERTFSSQLIKGVVGGEAKGVFQGKIHIAPDAQETEGRQLHKALLLSDSAEIDVKPELEIYADNVKCAHGAACGELDKEQLFYMRSRGIGEDEARQILIDAYLNDVIARVSNPEIREWLRSRI